MPDVKEFKFWCQKVLPLVYDDSLSYYETLCKVVQKLNEVIGFSNNFDYIVDEAKAELRAEIAQEVATLNQTINGLEDDLDAKIQTVQRNLTLAQELLQTDLNKVKADLAVVQEWVAQFDWDRLTKIVHDIVDDYVPSQLSVRLDDSGHLIIDYWKPWQDLVFGTTGYDTEVPIQPEYGHLVVSY